MVQQLKETHADQEQNETFKPLEQSECQQAFVMASLVFFSRSMFSCLAKSPAKSEAALLRAPCSFFRE
jgi:hypothetical protein